MKLRHWRLDLQLAHSWRIARRAGTRGFTVVFAELRSPDGRSGLGEAAPSERYGETVDTVETFLERVDLARLSFDDLPGSTAYLETVAPGNHAAKGCVNIALLDAAARERVC